MSSLWKVIGHHSINEVLKKRPRDVSELLIRESYSSSADLKNIYDQAKKSKVKIQLVGDKKLNQAQTGHQGAVLTVSPFNPEPTNSGENSLVLVLDGIEDPQNLGAIVRTAWLMEVDRIYIPKDRSTKMTAAAIKIASGGAEHVPVEMVTNISRTIEELKEKSYWVSGLAEGGSDQLHKWQPEEKVCLVIGAEDSGIRKKTAQACDRLIEIWQTPGGASYNASVAAALAISRYRNSKLV